MRNQQAPTVRVNVFYPEIEPQCKDSAETCRIYTVPAGHPKKVRMCLTSKEQGGVLSSTGQLNVASPSECQRYQDSTRGKLLLAQPVFVIDNKERPIKRHAAELIWKSENEHSIYPEKRARSSSFTYRASHSPNHKDNRDSDRRRRSSSFTLLPTFPAMKNNIFMPSTILKVHPEGAVTELGRLHDGNVIKPATLQPPKGLPCQNGKTDGSGSASQKCQDDDKSSSLEQIRTPLNNVDKPKPALEPTCILGTKTRNQHFEKISTTKNNISDFIFGEKMNERVKSPPGSADTQTGLSLVNPSPIGKQPPLCSWAYQKHCGKNTGLIESAAAYTSKSSLKYTPDQVEIITGEESERNVLQVNCKLFTLNKDTQMWIERGRGYLRLNDTARNDSGMFKSRIVTGCIRNIDSTCGKVWASSSRIS
ncbi:ran-binding protein 3-like isoform 2-T2 [Discoglossus pictus]